ncbi:hypothetical protein M422DRAFT_275923 [Sphaerobolus stellatus SS14]|uniref:Uncharacterized protein n=1 Tax=Sphaerobolus stellatus (strain SS14) TaxID=990650 RepID=A0A0C9TNN3_SPHS4|nr:hypothetical protein M422DRAFT_275923 [Sphaerobolus stellatus SS14]
MPLSVFALPLPSNGPPSGYSWEECDASALSTTTAFHSVIDRRDIFLGQRRCIDSPDNPTHYDLVSEGYSST